MMTLSSTGQLLDAMRKAREVRLIAYTLPAGRVLDGLIQAAKGGAHVRVRLEGYIYKDDGTVSATNASAVAALQAAGADAALMHTEAGSKDAMLHAKAAVVDDALFLDDRNWPDDDADTIVRDDFPADAAIVRDALDGHEDRATPFFSIAKRQSLASEERLLREGHKGDDVIVESESFGGHNGVYCSLVALAREGAHVRVLVNSRDLNGNGNERRAIAQLERDGAEVRVTDADEKFAVVNGSHGWIGSTNATVAFDHPDQLDWGARTNAPVVLDHVEKAFEERWALAASETGTTSAR